jgi:flagellar basal-body rod modification protein FlgD
VLSPDGDATGGTSTMTVSLGDNAGLNSWRVEVRSETTGALVRTVSKLRATAGTDTLAWDGRNESGQVVPNGSYVLSATALDTSDNRSAPCSLGLTVSSVFDSPELSPP